MTSFGKSVLNNKAQAKSLNPFFGGTATICSLFGENGLGVFQRSPVLTVQLPFASILASPTVKQQSRVTEIEFKAVKFTSNNNNNNNLGFLMHLIPA